MTVTVKNEVIEEKTMAETSMQLNGNSTKKSQRQKLFSRLDVVLEVADKKFKMEKAPNDDRQAWARVITQCVQVYGKILNDDDLEEVKARLTELEKVIGAKQP